MFSLYFLCDFLKKTEQAVSLLTYWVHSVPDDIKELAANFFTKMYWASAKFYLVLLQQSVMDTGVTTAWLWYPEVSSSNKNSMHATYAIENVLVATLKK